MTKTDEHRDFVTTALCRITTDIEYIKDSNKKTEKHLEKLNNRVRKNENTISWIKGVGLTITFVISSVLGFFMKE